MTDPRRFYRLLLRLYPARFREEYETAMEQQFWDDYRSQRGTRARIVFWLHAFADLAMSVPVEFLQEVWRDLCCSVRVYRQRLLSSILALFAMSLAIGVTTGVFSVVSALLLRSLPFREPERLVQISVFSLVTGGTGVKNWGLHSGYLDGAAEFSTSEMTLGGVGEPLRVRVAETSSNFFDILGVEPQFGRAFEAEEDLPGRNRAAIIGHGLWQQETGGDPRVLGSAIRLNGMPLTVVGIAPPGFDYPARTEVWTATGAGGRGLPRPAGVRVGAIIGRLKPGVSVALARKMFLAEVKRSYPEGLLESVPSFARLTLLRDELAGPVGQASMILLGAAGLVLMIACANVAQLLLSRTTERKQELAIRAALGASRARLAQQLITEAVGLTMASTAAGLMLAPIVSRMAAAALPAQLMAQPYVVWNWQVLGFAVLLALLTGLLFGVLPALMVGWLLPSCDGLGSRPGIAYLRTGWVRIGLIIVQAALSIILLAGSIVMGRSFLKVTGTELGFQTDHLVSMTVSLAGILDGKNREAEFYRTSLERLRAVPGVEAVGAVRYLPLVGNDYQYLGGHIKVDSGGVVEGNIVTNAVSSGYFNAMRTAFVAGRDFTAGEREGTEELAIVNEDFAKRSGLGSGVVGKKADAGMNEVYRIIGVVRTTPLGGPAFGPTLQLYIPLEKYLPGSVTYVVRVRGRAADYLPVCRAALQQVNRQIPVYDCRTLEQMLHQSLAKPRFYTSAVLFLGGFALLLAVMGIYGIATYSVTQRTHEIGVRIAVGASPACLRATLIWQIMVPVVIGTTAGVAGAIGSGRYLQHLLWSAEPLNIGTCALAALVLSVTAWMALWLATSRVIELDPMVTLKSE